MQSSQAKFKHPLAFSYLLHQGKDLPLDLSMLLLLHQAMISSTSQIQSQIFLELMCKCMYIQMQFLSQYYWVHAQNTVLYIPYLKGDYYWNLNACTCQHNIDIQRSNLENHTYGYAVLVILKSCDYCGEKLFQWAYWVRWCCWRGRRLWARCWGGTIGPCALGSWCSTFVMIIPALCLCSNF